MRYIVGNRVFDTDRAETHFEEEATDRLDGKPIGIYSKSTHLRTHLYLTRDGEWFIVKTSLIWADTLGAKLITEADAKLWLVVNGLDNDFQKLFNVSAETLLKPQSQTNRRVKKPDSNGQRMTSAELHGFLSNMEAMEANADRHNDE